VSEKVSWEQILGLPSRQERMISFLAGSPHCCCMMVPASRTPVPRMQGPFRVVPRLAGGRSRPWATRIRTLQHARTLSLAYTLQRPADGEIDERYAPIIMMHGLFGSKQNNRSISK
jgi:hypothetical protein